MAIRPERSGYLYQETGPAKPGNPLFCHEEFLQQVEENRNSPVGKRASLLLQRLLVDLSRQYYKSTQGVNRGWRRSPLGGNHGSHFYAWWAPAGSIPLRDEPDFETAPDNAVFLRAIRHHDDHSLLNPQSWSRNYLPIGVKELREEDYVPAPWTQGQARFAASRQNLRIIKGHPGSGKTTALWHATDLACRESALYVTYSSELASLAREYFEKYAPGNKRYRVVTFAQLVREILDVDLPFEPVRISRSRFVKETAGFSPTILGVWQHQRGPLYDEMFAHLVGAVLPYPVGRFPSFKDQRVSARQYREMREGQLGRAAAESAAEVAETLRRRDERDVVERFFPELRLAWRAAVELREHRSSLAARRLLDFDCIAIDEAQDLTPLETLLFVELADAAQTERHSPLHVFAAGDEAQTVRPTDFEWGWFQDMIHHRLGSPADFRLATNLRSPQRIAELVNRTSALYSALVKSDRPSGATKAEIDEVAGDQILFCAASVGEDLFALLTQLSQREGTAIISLGDEVPSWVPESLRDRVLTSFEAKGLDFQSVCVLDGGRLLAQVHTFREHGRGLELDELTRRLAIDQLRVAVSRPAERLIWLDVNPSERALAAATALLSFDNPEFPVVPALVLKTLEEDTLPLEDRVRMCVGDARQLLDVKPALAWSRARQAVALLGDRRSEHAIADQETRRSAHLTLAQVAFTLAFRRVNLSSEMGRPDLFGEARDNATEGHKLGLAALMHEISLYERDYSSDKTPALRSLAVSLVREADSIEPWLQAELRPRATGWLRTLEDQAHAVAPDLLDSVLPALYKVFEIPDGPERLARLRDKAIRRWISIGAWPPALRLLNQSENPDPVLVAQCHEGIGEHEEAARRFAAAGHMEDALRNYRSIPDFDKALELIETMPDHPARESLLWVRKMRDLAARRPAEFSKALLPAEKKLLEQILETSLGASRKKAAAKKAPAKKAAPRKRPAKPLPRPW